MRTVIAILLLIVIDEASAEESWSQFRGPLGNGHSEASHGPAEWDEATNIRWKASIPGTAWSSPVFNESLIWMTTAEVFELSDEQQEAIRKASYKDHVVSKQLVIVDKVRLRAVAIDAQTAELIHDVALFTVDRPTAIHELNSYASPTVVSDNGIATCLDALSGERHWRERLGGNFCASPIYVAGNLYFGNCEGQTTVVAAGSTYNELSKNELDGVIAASPVVLGEDLLIRTDSHLYRISDR